MLTAIIHWLCGYTSLLLFACTLIGYLYLRNLYTYWDRRGIDTPIPSSFPFGSFGKLFMQKCNFGELMQEFYYSSSKPLIGVYAGVRPMVICRDPELIQRILTKDFQHFTDRGWYYNPGVDPLTNHLLMAPAEKWRRMRAIFAPTFTLGKLKSIFPGMVHHTRSLEQYMDGFADRDVSLEMNNVCSRFTINVIASTAFGVDINCFTNPNEGIFVYGKKFFELTAMNSLRQFMMFMSPKLMGLLRMRLYSKDIADFMMAMVQANLEHREKENVVRKDFFQMLVQIRNGGVIGGDDTWEAEITGDEKKKSMSIADVAAQAYIFLLAGYETSASAISFCLYELARHPDLQAKLHAEIDQVLATYDGQITYECLGDMKYLDCCLDETLRKYPPLPGLSRECTLEYRVPGTELVIEKGTPVMIPAWALHYDDKIYPEPYGFKPDRFSDDNRKNFVDQPWMPFGQGPRACLGLQMGRTQSKIGLIAMLRKYRFELGAQMPKSDLEISKKHMVPTAVSGIHLKIKSRP